MVSERTKAWGWVSIAFFGEGLPYAVINIMLLAMLADLKVSNGIAVLLTSVIALPWSLKALWSPVVENYGTKKKWMISLMVTLTILMAAIAFFLDVNLYLLTFLALASAITAATYDVSCDGHYMRVLNQSNQAYFVGIRTTTYRIGMLLASGGLVALCGWFMMQGISTAISWSITFGIIAGIFALLALILKPLLPQDKRQHAEYGLAYSYKTAIVTFFTNRSGRQLAFMLAFLFLYRMGESLLSKITILFLKDSIETGGIGLNNEQYGLLYGTCGVLALIVGGILGGMAISRYGLRKCIIPMALTLNLPDLLYVWLAYTQTYNLWIIGSVISIEQLGYGFGLAAYTVYLMQCAKGQHETAHYAFLTAIMILSLLLPSMISGYMQQWLGYLDFFWAAILLSAPGIILSVWYAIKPVR